jgi:uncharacterized protein YjbI with pentapeptide repeats
MLELKTIRQQIQAIDADLSGSTFTNVNLRGTAIDDANLSNLRISDANLTGASIVDSNLEGMTINGIAVKELLSVYRAARK